MAGLDLQVIQDAKDVLNEDKAPHIDFMRVSMNGTIFLVAVDEVSSVVRPAVMTAVPMAPDHLIGVTNIRGQICCIIDAGKVLKLPKPIQEKTTQTRFLLLKHDRVHLGLWVEAVNDLYSIPMAEVPVDSGEKYSKGLIRIGDEELPILRVAVLLD